MNEARDSDVIVGTNLHKSYAEGALRVDVLRGINLCLSLGRSLAIIGASGSGKSTLLHILGGLDLPDRGEVSILGRSATSLSEAARGRLRNKSLGFIYQFHHLLPEFSALENVAMPLLIAREYSAEAAKTAASNMLAKVGLAARAAHKPTELSGGERQRAAIARALVSGPQCILADEPTGNLDEKTAAQVFELILALKHEAGTSLLMVTHNLSLAEQMDQTYQLHDGCLERG